MNEREPASQPGSRGDFLEQDDLPASEEMIRRLLEADFSAESSLRKRLRERLEQRIEADKPTGWIDNLGISLPRLGATTPLKVGLLVFTLLAQVWIAPNPTPVIADQTQPVFPVYATLNTFEPPGTVETTASIANQPIPIPTPSVGVIRSSPLYKPATQVETTWIQASSSEMHAGTPKPTPLAPVTSLP